MTFGMEAGDGKPIGQEWFENLLAELTGKFGGATSFMRTPGQGLWRNGGETWRDNIAVVEVMADRLEPEYCPGIEAVVKETGWKNLQF